MIKKRIDEPITRNRVVEMAPVEQFKPKYMSAQSLADRIRLSRERKGITQESLRKLLDYKSRSTIAQWERGESSPSVDQLAQVAQVLNVPPQFLAFGISQVPVEVAPDPDKLGYALVPEVAIADDPDAPSTIQKWGLPTQWLRSELHCQTYDDLIIFKVETDAEEFTYGDRIVVDRASRKPSPPGNFLYWDGLGAVVAKISVVPTSGNKVMARVTTSTGTHEVPADKLHIIGRVKGIWKQG